MDRLVYGCLHCPVYPLQIDRAPALDDRDLVSWFDIEGMVGACLFTMFDDPGDTEPVGEPVEFCALDPYPKPYGPFFRFFGSQFV